MPAASRVSPTDIFTPEEWAPFRQRSAYRGLLLVAHVWGVIGLAMAAGIVWPILLPLCVMIIGTRQLGLAILMHEAAHGGLSTSARINDWVGHWFCAVPVGASLVQYRAYHLTHHRFAQQPEDPDLVLSSAFPVSRASLRRKIFRDLTGQTFFKQRVLAPLASRVRKDLETPGTHHEYDTLITSGSTLPFVLFNAVLLMGLALAGFWWAYFVLWLLPLATWFPLVTRLRNIAEHACVEGSDTDPYRAARTTRVSWWEKAFIAPYWVNFHAEHHLFMFVTCDKLPALHRLLERKRLLNAMEISPNYLSVIRRVTYPI